MLAPAALPKPLLQRVHGDLIKVLRMADVKEKLSGQGFDILASSPEEFGATIRGDIAKYTKVIKAAGIKEN